MAKEEKERKKKDEKETASNLLNNCIYILPPPLKITSFPFLVYLKFLIIKPLKSEFNANSIVFTNHSSTVGISIFVHVIVSQQ